LLDWEDRAEGVEDPDMPYYLGGGGGGGQPPPPPPPPPGPQGGGGGVPAHAPVVGGAGKGGVAPGALPPPVQGDLDDVVKQPVGGGMACSAAFDTEAAKQLAPTLRALGIGTGAEVVP
jgi:hypothetical protein